MKDLVKQHKKYFSYKFAATGVNLKGDRNVENKNMSQLFAQNNHGSFYFGSLHNFFYIHPSKFADKENWSILSQVSC